MIFLDLMMSLKTFLMGVFFAGAFTYYIVPLCSQLAIQLNIIDRPDGKLKQHEKVTPYLGGLAVFGGILIGCACCSNMIWSASFICGIVMLLGVGLVDDIVSLSPSQKIVWQFFAACFICASGGMIAQEVTIVCFFWGFTDIMATMLGCLVEMMFILTITNAFNLIDIMDGLAATAAIGSSLMLTLVAYKICHINLLIYLVMCVTALIAFLYYNKPRACIYLGDSGSLMIGGFLAGIACQVPWHAIISSPLPISCITVGCMLTTIFFIPFFELIMLIVIRSYKSLSFFLGSSHHFIHYLKNKRFSIYSILGIVYCTNIGLFLNLALFLFNVLTSVQYILITMIIAVVWISFVYQSSLKNFMRLSVYR